jgi:hypothetical protein
MTPERRKQLYEDYLGQHKESLASWLIDAHERLEQYEGFFKEMQRQKEREYELVEQYRKRDKERSNGSN